MEADGVLPRGSDLDSISTLNTHRLQRALERPKQPTTLILTFHLSMQT